MPDQIRYTLGESLAAPMNEMHRFQVLPDPGSNPSVMPWTVGTWHLIYGTGRNFSAAHATRVSNPLTEPERWYAYCAGPGDTRMEEAEFPTAEAAKAAVEEHYLAHVDTGLSEEPE